MDNYHGKVLLAMVEPFKADLSGMSDDDIDNEMSEVQERIDTETDWVEAMAAEQKLRANK